MAIRPDDLTLVKAVPLFSQLPAETLDRVLAGASVQPCPRGTVLFHQGDAAAWLHILLEGQVGLLGLSQEGGETVVEILAAGECFIAAAVLTEKPYLMTAKVLKDARVLLLPGDQLRADLKSNPELATAMLASLSKHFRMLVREVKDLKLKSSAQRLGIYLLGLTPNREGSTIVRLPYNKTVIAARVGIRPESLSRIFAALGEIGVVVRAQDVLISDLTKLVEFCRDEDEIM